MHPYWLDPSPMWTVLCTARSIPSEYFSTSLIRSFSVTPVRSMSSSVSWASFKCSATPWTAAVEPGALSGAASRSFWVKNSGTTARLFFRPDDPPLDEEAAARALLVKRLTQLASTNARNQSSPVCFWKRGVPEPARWSAKHWGCANSSLYIVIAQELICQCRVTRDETVNVPQW